MTTAVQLRRGTTAETATFTGLEGETTVDTTKDTLVVHNGSTAGGFPIAREDLTNVSPSNLPSITGSATASDDKFLIYDQSALTLKQITRAELNNAMEQDPLSNVQIVSGTINGTTIGGTTAAGGSFTTLNSSGATTLNGTTIPASKTLVDTDTAQTLTNKTLTSPAITTPTGIVKGDVGLGNVDNTSDATKNAATATLTNKTINLTSNTLVATSAQIAAAVTDETGTGSLVFANSPTLVTPALGTPASGVVTNLTGTASININGTVGATTASTGAFTTLAASGDVTLSGGTANGVAFLNGSKVLTTGSALTFDGTVLRNTSGQFEGVDNMTLLALVSNTNATALTLNSAGTSGTTRFQINNSEQMRLTSTGLGIGTSSPETTLGVASGGSNGFTSGTLPPGMTIHGTAANGFGTMLSFKPGFGVQGVSGIGSFRVSGFQTDLRFYTNNTNAGDSFSERMRIDSAGSVLVGTTANNGRKFRVYGSGDLVELVSTNSGAGGAQIDLKHESASPADGDIVGIINFGGYDSGNNNTQFASIQGVATSVSSETGELRFGTRTNASTYNSSAMVLTSAGNVGIGTSSPVSQLSLFKGSGENGVRFQNTATGTLSSDGAFVGLGATGGDSNGLNLFTYDATSVIFGTEGGERMRIATSGNLLVGTTSGWFSRRVVVEGTEGLAGIVQSNTQFPISLVGLDAGGNNLFAGFYTDSRSSPLLRGTIDYNRGSNVVRYNTTSDATLKNLIGDSDKSKSCEILSSTKIREYSWKDDEAQKPQIGVIAQELHETFKGAVSVGGEQEDGTYRPWAVDKTAFTFHLIAGWQAHEKIIQEQQAIINDLKARLDAANL